MRILVVDDEEGIRQICQRSLRGAGHEVETCATGREALSRLQEPWDMIFSDLAMPGGVDGAEVLRRAGHEGGPDLVLMTAYPTVSSSISVLKSGACDYLLKPFSLDALLKVVERQGKLRDRARRSAADLARLLSPDIADWILHGGPETPLRRRTLDLTVLFADVRGFTAFARSVPAEEAAARLDGMMACFVEAVQAEGGTVNKFMGDGALALFGAPRPLASPAAAGARAALRARDAVAKLGGLRFGFGLNHGEAVVGGLGPATRAEYGVIGHAVNVAARLEAAAGPGEILAGPGALAGLEAGFDLSEPKAMSLKGMAEPVHARAVLGLRS